MAIYHLSVKQVTRGQGKSVVASASYRSATKLTNLYDGVTHDYTKKNWVTHVEVMLPQHVKETKPQYEDIGTLMNAIELGEKASDARLASEIEIALPQEMTLKQQKALIREYIQKNFVEQGRCALVCLHNPPKCDDLGRPIDKDGNVTNDRSKMIFGNPHAHVLVTCRPIDEKGRWECKTQIEYLCKRGDEVCAFTSEEFKLAKKQGWQKQFKYRDPTSRKAMWLTQEEASALGYDNSHRTSRQPKTTPYGRENPTTRYWNESARVKEWRESWANLCNKKLKEYGYHSRIDHRSLFDQGRGDEIASVHMGPEATYMERRAQRLIKEGMDPSKVKHSHSGELNQTIREYNQLVRNKKTLEDAKKSNEHGKGELTLARGAKDVANGLGDVVTLANETQSESNQPNEQEEQVKNIIRHITRRR